MLVITRKAKEYIRIEVDKRVIMIAVLDIQNSRVRLGVQADSTVKITREPQEET